ncbi:hypothetical protein NL676_023439 [Syzygium grande]|nr:hypothetical protein NL676_023439 [Syzygium grande]
MTPRSSAAPLLGRECKAGHSSESESRWARPVLARASPSPIWARAHSSEHRPRPIVAMAGELERRPSPTHSSCRRLEVSPLPRRLLEPLPSNKKEETVIGKNKKEETSSVDEG